VGWWSNLKIFSTTKVVFIANTRIGVDNCGRGVMFGGITKTGLETNT
jgi:ribonuclease HIII